MTDYRSELENLSREHARRERAGLVAAQVELILKQLDGGDANDEAAFRLAFEAVFPELTASHHTGGEP
jgi:hypothetical protein